MSEHEPPREPASGETPESARQEPIPLEAEEAPAKPSGGKPRIDSPGLLDDFDEDADFESDPEVERVVSGIPVKSKTAPRPEASAEPDPARGEPISPGARWKLYAVPAAVLTLTGAVFAGIYAGSSEWAHVLLVLYRAALHTGTGVGAIVLASVLLGRPVGRFDSAAAKMWLCVSLFLVIYSLGMPLTGGKLEEVVFGTAAYFAGLMFAFRMAPRDAAVIGGAHFGLALIVTLGNMLTGVVAAGAAG